MVKNVIKVFARIKNENLTKRSKLENYIVSSSKEDYEDLIIHHRCKNNEETKYHKVFDQNSSQKEIFETVAKPVVHSVIHGFNGTIFAYGQTGSGKTYSITGCPKNYENRGIIPRCIEEIFDYLNQDPDVFNVHLSYLEIYNEIGYDLLNPKQSASKLEEFPRVLLLEDGKGEAHLRNLTIHPVSTEKEAMRFLFLGDTNRTIAETPMNDYSSRSHCIFTIYLRTRRNGKNIKSKLHIVDLAGSERIRKSNITGMALNEAKNINLSLHYLEQVILALSSSKKKLHIPFRNSMLTYLLKDSLCGNSLTTMVATLAITKKNIDVRKWIDKPFQRDTVNCFASLWNGLGVAFLRFRFHVQTFKETISTCKFSRRVSMITTDPRINSDELDSNQEISLLYDEITALKSKLMEYENKAGVICEKHGEQQLKPRALQFEEIVRNFLEFKSDLDDLKLPELKVCMDIIREKYSNVISSEKPRKQTTEIRCKRNSLTSLSDEDVLALQESLKSQNCGKKEFSVFNNLTNSRCTNPYEFIKAPRVKKVENDFEECKRKLEQKYADAEKIASAIEDCRQNIMNIRTKLEQNFSGNVKYRQHLQFELFQQQDFYRNNILKLRTLEKETNHLKNGIYQLEKKMSQNPNPVNNYINSKTYENEPKLQKNWSTSSENSDEYYENQFNLPERESSSQFPHMKNSKDRPSFLEILTELDDTPREDKYSYFDDVDIEPEKLTKQTPPVTLPRLLPSIQEPFPKTQKPANLNSKCHKNDFHHEISENFREIENEFKPTSEKIVKDRNTPTDWRTEKYMKSANEAPVSLHKIDDSKEFKEFMKSIPLTGDREVDDEIFEFYRTKFNKQ